MKIAENPASAGKNESLRRAIERSLREGWTIKRVAGMTTEAIEAQLHAYGVSHSRERFLRLAEGRDSAWSISEVWFETDPITCRGQEEDFLGLAACELWKRLLPERPSVEMLDDWMQEGYTLLEQERGAAACDLWWKVWSTLRSRFDGTMTTLQSTYLVFNGLQSLFNWTQDFELALEQVSSRDPRYAQLGQQYCSDWIAQFRDEGGLEQVNIRRTLAFFRFRLGDAGGAAAALHETVERWPGNVWGYVALADAYSHADPGGNIFPLDPQKARSYLERALALPGLDEYERDAVHERLEELSRV